MKACGAIMAMAAVMAGRASAPKVDNSSVRDFDLVRYLGDWHEIALFGHWFKRGAEEAKAPYPMLAEADRRGYDTSRLLWIRQKD